ncbi:DUF3383 family protein [Alcaligenes phenolicus]|uniref:DUF3383 family protein n=1 Tax=Alcaligenes phenolicus TaxID=232846 RepID=UPI000E97400A|nr:DUF3383 family protein [Alcaligenes phenolicus]HBJ68558.1 hypothetical protein [Alcaligenes faecalis]
MAKLSRIANVDIALRTTTINEQSFSDMLILGSHVLSTARAMTITAADELLDMGLQDTDPLFWAARDAFAQIPAVRQVFIGRRQVDELKISVSRAVPDADYRVQLRWRDEQGQQLEAQVSYKALEADTVGEIASGLASAIAQTAAPVTATADEAVVTVKNKTAGTALAVQPQGNLAMQVAPSTETVTQALSTIANGPFNWYGLVMTSRVIEDVLSAAAWTESNEKLFGTASADASILDPDSTDDLASQLQAKQYFRSFGVYSAAAEIQYPEAALMSSMFTYYPGQETWALKKLAGIAYDELSEGQALVAHGKSFSTFEPFRNFAVTQGGLTAAGEWIDVIRLRDALVEQIKVSVVSAMINADGKVAFTDDGIQMIGNAIRAPLDLNVRRGGIATEELDENDRIVPSYTLSLPRSNQVPFNDKANRVLRDVYFTARLAGAIHVSEIKGSLSYAL